MTKKYLNLIIKFVAIIITIFILLFIIFGIKQNISSSNDGFINYIKSYGIIAPLIFIFIQIIQVIFPIIPGGASCLAGVLAFGSFYGFIYNYIGLCIGSICNFFLARHYGIKIINFLFKKDSINNYLNYIKSKKFNNFFLLSIFMPGAPDDLLCYIAGISNINFWSFLVIIILGKPLTLIFYSIFSNYLI